MINVLRPNPLYWQSPKRLQEHIDAAKLDVIEWGASNPTLARLRLRDVAALEAVLDLKEGRIPQ